MNQRIKELMDEVIEFRLDPDSKHYEAQVNPEHFEMFAELIVAECVELVSVNRDLAIEEEWNVDEAMSTAINDIEEHFGVEE